MDSPISVLRVTHGQAALAALADRDGVSTPFATPGWIAAFVPEARRETLVAFDITLPEGSLILPLTLRKCCGVTLAVCPGGALANYHAPVLSGLFPTVPARDLIGFLKDCLEMVEADCPEIREADCLLLTDMPPDIGGITNPLALPGAQPSPDVAHGLTLSADFEGLQARLFDRDARKKQRQKAKKRLEFGEARAAFLADGPERDACLAQLLRWKADRFAKSGIRDPFAGQDAQAALSRGLANGSLRLFALFAGPRLLAGLIGAMHQGAFSGLLNAHDPAPEIEKTSPGEALLLALVEALCLEGAKRFDLGTGEARYKAGICPEVTPLVDMAVAVTLRGRLAARVFLAMRALKGWIKRSARARAIIGDARRFKAKFSGR